MGTHRRCEVYHRLAREVRLLMVSLDLDLDHMYGSVEVPSSCEQVYNHVHMSYVVNRS